MAAARIGHPTAGCFRPQGRSSVHAKGRGATVPSGRVDGAPWVRIHGKDVRANAQRHTIGGLSAHTDQKGLIEWCGRIGSRPALALVHGEDEDKAREALAGEIGERYRVEVKLARPGMTLMV